MLQELPTLAVTSESELRIGATTIIGMLNALKTQGERSGLPRMAAILREYAAKALK